MSSAGAGGGAGASCLQDVVALVHCPPDVATNAKAAITARIEKHGGRAVARLGREVSHIIWERRHSRRPSDKAADEAELLELFRKLEKSDYPPVVVSPLWVEESIKAGRRLVERKYLVKKPMESLLGRTPGTGGAAAAKKRKRPAAAVLPKPAEAFQLDDLVYSSTQQMAGGGQQAGQAGVGAAAAQDDADDATSPRKRRGGAAGFKAPAPAQRGAPAGGLAAVVEEGEAEDEGAQQQQQQQQGSGTQAVAKILAIDLPADDAGLHGTPGPAGAAGAAGEEELDELDTPLSVRFAKQSSAERAAAWSRAADELGAAGGGGARDAGRSRLALASGPAAQAATVAAAVEEAVEAIEDADSEGEAPVEMQEDAAPEAAVPPTQDEPQTAEEAAPQQQGQQQDEEQPPQQNEEQPPQQHEEEPAAAAKQAAAKLVAQRFSVRQLVQHPERTVVVHRGTPLAAVAPPANAAKPLQPIPIPVVERVTSPWALAEQLPTQSQASQPAEASGRPSVGGPAARPGGRRSLLGVSHVRRSSGGSAPGATPASAVRANPTGGDGKLPSPWSSLRPWDSKAAVAGGGATPAGQNENQAGPPQQPAQEQEPAAAAAAEEEPPAPAAEPSAACSDGGGGSGTRRSRPRRGEAAPASDSAGGSAAAGPSHGCIALTSVDLAVVELARSATRRLRGMRLCPEGREDGQITHLVIADERRTLKLMLAVAQGAWLLSPGWVTASLEAGRWLPESQFPAQVRFEAAAARARCLLEAADAAPLLAEHSLYVHLPEKARKTMGANVAALKRVAAVLGAKVVPPKACSLCVVVGGGARPPHIPSGARCVQEEWLLQAAERFEVPAVDEYLVK